MLRGKRTWDFSALLNIISDVVFPASRISRVAGADEVVFVAIRIPLALGVLSTEFK